MTVARAIAENVAPMSAALSKRLLWVTLIRGYSPRQVASADAREGVQAFLRRRTPRWTGSVLLDWEPLPGL